MSAATGLRGHGITVALPAQWEGRIYRRAMPAADRAVPALHAAVTDGPHPAGTGWLGEQTYPVTHLANFPLPAGRGDFGTGAVERMGPQHIFVALLEYGSDCVGTALYERQGMPRPRPDDFRPNALQRRLAGQCGYQAFFTETGRAMCLYVVLGSYADRSRLARQASAVLDGIEVAPR